MSVFVLQNCGQKAADKNTATATEQLTTEENIPIETADTLATNNNQLITNKTDNTKHEVTAAEKKVQEPVKKPELTVVKPATPDNKPVTAPVKPPEVKTPEPVKPAPAPTPVIVDDPKPAPVVIQPVDPNKWIVPTKYLNMANPYPANSESISTGKSLFSTHCRSCHGSKGDGNGTKAASLNTKVESFLTSTFQSQKPGAIYYKSIFGRDDMPKFDKKIPDEEDRWAIVNFIMSLK